MSQQLRRHGTLPDLSTPDDLGVPDSRHDGLGLPSHPTDIADPHIFMLSEAIKQTLSSSFNGLQSTLTTISTQMERIAPRPSGGGGGGLPDCRGNIPQEDEDSDAVSLLPAEDIPLPILPQMGRKFRVFQDSINKTSEPLASPPPEDMASCFNATYHKTSLAETSEVKDLLTTTLRPSNINMVVRTTNNGLFSLKDPAMPNICRDAKAEGSLVKSSYVTMKLTEELAQAHSRGDLSPQL